MTSQTTKKFRQLYAALPSDIQSSAMKAYRLWRENAWHPALRFKQVLSAPPVFSVRITRAFRALGVKEDNTLIWFWIGSHGEYEMILARGA